MAIADVSSRSIAELIDLTGKVAVVTGGAQGLGKAISRRFAEAGASVVSGDVNADGAQATVRELAASTGGNLRGTAVDVRKTASIDALAQKAVDELGGFDIWVNNAGVYPTTDVLAMSDADWDDVVAINLRGSFTGSRTAARHMVERGQGGGSSRGAKIRRPWAMLSSAAPSSAV